MPRKLPEEIQEQVRQRAGYLCEYCHTDEHWQYVRFTIDHLVPASAGGTDTVENLALACFHCNRRKSDRQTALDPHTGQLVALFNPRLHSWSDHFIWSADGLRIIGQTAIGRTAVELLEFNRERVIGIRLADVSAGRHPPASDPVQPRAEETV